MMNITSTRNVIKKYFKNLWICVRFSSVISVSFKCFLLSLVILSSFTSLSYVHLISRVNTARPAATTLKPLQVAKLLRENANNTIDSSDNRSHDREHVLFNNTNINTIMNETNGLMFDNVNTTSMIHIMLHSTTSDTLLSKYFPSRKFEDRRKIRSPTRSVQVTYDVKRVKSSCDMYLKNLEKVNYSRENISKINSSRETPGKWRTYNDALLRFGISQENCFGETLHSNRSATCRFDIEQCMNSSKFFSFTLDDDDVEDISILLRRYFTMSGGSWAPCECVPRQNLAIIIPYRDRLQHLKVFLNNIIPFLQFQRQAFTIFIVEQTEKVLFNRAALFNAAYREIQKLDTKYDGFVIHDVDMVPENLCTLYYAGTNPHHYAVYRSKLNYTLNYNGYAGGVLSLDKETVEQIHGMSNLFFGWGTEDDNMYARFLAQNRSLQRFSNCLGRVRTFEHMAASAVEERKAWTVSDVAAMTFYSMEKVP